MLKYRRLCLGLAVASLIVAGSAAIGCSSDGETTSVASSSSSSGSSSSSSSSSSGDGGAGGAPVCPTNMGPVLAVKTLYFGEGNSGEWKKFGYNLDGLVSTGNSKDVCTPNSGGMPSTAYPDGDNGIDNSFGKNLLPTVLQLSPTWTQDVNNGISNGRFTTIIRMLCLPDKGDAPLFTTKLLSGTTLGNPPKWDGTDVWPIEPGLLSDPMDPESATVLWSSSSIIMDKYNAGKDVKFIISVPIRTATSSTSIKLTLYAAQIQMDVAADRKSATNGMIGGVLNTEEFVAELQKVGKLMGLCGTALFDNLVTQVRQSSDILSDGTQDPSKMCDGISMGLGFDMGEAQIGMVGPANPQGDGCP